MRHHKYLNPAAHLPSSTRRQLLTGLLGGVGAGTVLALGKTVAQTQFELPNTQDPWAWVRAQQLCDSTLAYLNTAAFGPGIRMELVEQYRAAEAINTHPHTELQQAPAQLQALTTRMAHWLDCSSDELCLTVGATAALNMIANGLNLAPGDEVLTTTHEHAAALAPWLLQAQRRGITLTQIDLPCPLEAPTQVVALFEQAITPRTRVLVFSHIQTTDGAVLPVQELCALAKAHNIFSVVDGAQSLGALNFSLRTLDCDFYATSCHKWLNGPYGCGVLYVRANRLEQLWSPAAALDDEFTATHHEWPPTLRKLGTLSKFLLPHCQALHTALDWQEQLGRTRIETRIRELLSYARVRLNRLPKMEILTPAHPAMWCATISIRAPATAVQDWAASLARDYSVIVQPIIRTQPQPFIALRAAVHIYNTFDDIDRLARGLERYFIV